MAMYQLLIIERPEGWQPGSWDDVPPSPGEPQAMLAEGDDLWALVRQAMEHNERADKEGTRRWAVVVEPGSPGRAWREARLCTPVTYQVHTIWWPTGWEPLSPLDVPNCLGMASRGTDHPRLTYAQAVAVVRGLNQQSMDHQGSTWHVIVALENEPALQPGASELAGAQPATEVRPVHVIRPDPAARGDCSYCPARALECARA
jgi:hypothetical protein